MLLMLDLCPSSDSPAGMDPEKEGSAGACVPVQEDAVRWSCPGHSLAWNRKPV